MSIATALIHPTVALAWFASPPRSHPADIPPSFILTVLVLTPGIQNGNFPYRRNVKARISLRGNSPRSLDVVVGPMRLLCHAECQSCKSRRSSAHQSCNPVAFYLNPVQVLNHNQSFVVDHTGDSLTLINNVTFEIKARPRRPKAEDREWRCSSESLM